MMMMVVVVVMIFIGVSLTFFLSDETPACDRVLTPLPIIYMYIYFLNTRI